MRQRLYHTWALIYFNRYLDLAFIQAHPLFKYMYWFHTITSLELGDSNSRANKLIIIYQINFLSRQALIQVLVLFQAITLTTMYECVYRMSHILGRLRQLSACSTLSRMARVALSRHGQAALIPVGVSHTVKRLQPSMQMRYTSSTTNTMQDQPPGIGFMLNLGAGKVQMNHHWLRDHCRCDQCYNHNTSQKNILPHHIQPDIQPQNWQVTEQTLNVTWQDGHQSAYKLSWLQDNYHPATSQVTQQQLWDADTIKQHNVTPTQYEDYLMTEDNTGIKHLLNNLLVYGFGIVQGVPVSIEATQKVSHNYSLNK